MDEGRIVRLSKGRQSFKPLPPLHKMNAVLDSSPHVHQDRNLMSLPSQSPLELSIAGACVAFMGAGPLYRSLGAENKAQLAFTPLKPAFQRTFERGDA